MRECLRELEEEHNDRRPKTFDEILSRLEHTSNIHIVHSRKSVAGRFGDGDVSVYSGTSRRRISGALLSCLQDSIKRRNAERLTSADESDSTFIKKQLKSYEAETDGELLAQHLEENSEAVGEILRRSSEINMNEKTMTRLVSKRLREYGMYGAVVTIENFSSVSFANSKLEDLIS